MTKNLVDEFYNNVEIVQKKIRLSQKDNIEEAAKIVANTVFNGGITQAFGSGHSEAAALEVSGRAGGYICSKTLSEYVNYSKFETIEGVGKEWFNLIDVQENDCFFLISNSGRNPMHIDMALELQKKGIKIIVLTNLEASKNTTSRHSSGLKLYELADVVLDNCGWEGDCSIIVDELNINVGPTSSIASAYILNVVILRSMEMLIEKGFEPPIFKSANIDEGPEYNQKLLKKYQTRLNRL